MELSSPSSVRLSGFLAVLGLMTVALATVACSNGGGVSRQEMFSVTTGGPGLVAVGFDRSGGDRDAAVWTSPDGITWSRVPHDEEVLGGERFQGMRSVTLGGPGLVAVGLNGPGDDPDTDTAVWTSPDGITWSQTTATPTDPKALLERSRAAMTVLNSAHMEMEVTVKLREDEIMFWRMEYDGQFDGDQQLSSTSDFSGAAETYVARMVDDIVCYRDSPTGEWKIADESAANGFRLSLDGMRELFTEIGQDLDPKTLTMEVATLNGHPVYHITSSAARDPSSEHAELWVGTEDLLARQVLQGIPAPAPLIEGLIHGGVVPADVGEVFQTTLTRFSQFSQPVVLVAPVLGPSEN